MFYQTQQTPNGKIAAWICYVPPANQGAADATISHQSGDRDQTASWTINSSIYTGADLAFFFSPASAKAVN